MDLQRIFDAFSRRQESSSADILNPTIPETTRTRVLLWCSEFYGGERSFDRSDYRHEFWEDIHSVLCFRHGKAQLSDGPWSSSNFSAKDSLAFLQSCRGVEFLDFLEDVFRVDAFWRYQSDAADLVEELNNLLRVDALPFALTPMVFETFMSPGPFGGHEMEATRVREYPRVISLDSQPMHAEVIEPALQLMSRREFAAADAEYLAALEDLRKGDYEDCLTKACSAFESALKVIFEINRWPYSERDTANQLIKTLIERTELDPFFETTLQIVATLRNRLSSSHGAGSTERNVPRYLATYAVRVTGASVLLAASAAGVEPHG
jgi:hypothetical protein